MNLHDFAKITGINVTWECLNVKNLITGLYDILSMPAFPGRGHVWHPTLTPCLVLWITKKSHATITDNLDTFTFIFERLTLIQNYWLRNISFQHQKKNYIKHTLAILPWHWVMVIFSIINQYNVWHSILTPCLVSKSGWTSAYKASSSRLVYTLRRKFLPIVTKHWIHTCDKNLLIFLFKSLFRPLNSQPCKLCNCLK